MLDASAPREYLIGHLEEAFLKDERLAEQGLHIAIENDPLVIAVSGVVSDVAHKLIVGEVIRTLLPSAEIRDCTITADYPESQDSETLP